MMSSENQEFYSTIVNAAPNAIAVCSQGQLVFINPTGARLLGAAAPSEIIGKPISDFVARWEKNRACTAQGDTQPITLELIRLDGAVIDGQISTAPITYRGQPALLMSVYNITEQVQIQAALRYRLTMDELATTISTRFINTPPAKIDQEIKRALQASGQLVEVDRCYIVLFQADGHTVDRRYDWHALGVQTRTHHRPGTSLAPLRWAMGKLARCETICVSDVADLPPEASVEKEIWQRGGTQSVLAIPLVVGNTLIGFFGFGAERGAKEWREEDIKLLKLMGEILGNALTRKRAEKALWASEAWNRALLEAIPDMIFVLDGDGAFLDYKGKRKTILPNERFIGRNIADIFPPEIAQPTLHHIKEALHTGQVRQYEYQLPFKDKFPTPTFEARVSVSGDNQVIILEREITERVKAEQALRESERRYRLLAENATDMISRHTPQGAYLYASPVCRRLLGYAPDELLGQDAYSLFHPDDLKQIAKSHAHILKDAGISQVPYRIRHKDGHYLWVETTSKTIHDPATGKVREIICITRDIGERMRTEQELRFQAMLMDQIQDQIIATDLTGQITFINQAVVRILGRSREELLGQKIHTLGEDPDAGATQQEIIDNTLANGAWHGNVVNYAKDGSKKIMDARTWLIQGPNDAPAGMIGVSTDITAHVQTQQTLERYAERLKTLHEIDQAILAAHSTGAIAQAALSHMHHLIPCRRTSVTEFDLKTNTARVVAAYMDGETRLVGPGNEFILHASTVETLQRGQIQMTGDTTQAPGSFTVDRTLYNEGIRAYVNVPLVVQGELVGSLNLGAENPDLFSTDCLDIAAEIAASLAIALRQARLYEQTRQDAATKATLLQEINHRVKNNLTAIIGLLYAEERYSAPETQPFFDAMVERLTRRIQGLITVHHMLSASQWSPLSLSDLAHQVTQATLQTIPSPPNIAVDVSPSAAQVNAKQANSLALVLHELVTNAVKHAPPGRAKLHIAIQASQHGEMIKRHKVTLEFRDDGSGFPQEVLDFERHSVGLYLIRRLVRIDLRGTLTLHNDDGAVITIRFNADPRNVL
jgi:PAS domain S-box-containing protein